jgi:hypothetical protein
MTYYDKKSTKRIFTSLSAVLMIFSGVFGVSYAYADAQSDFTNVTNDDIKNNAAYEAILANIEKSKNTFSDIQQQTIQQKLLDEQRSIAKKILEQELEQMFSDNEDFTSINVFNNFLGTITNEDTKSVFKGLFNYQQEKVNAARIAWNDALSDGGTVHDALSAYHEAAKISRADMAQMVSDLNVNAGFSNVDIQKQFDEHGQLPRYGDNHESAVSFVDLTTSAKNVNSSEDSVPSDDVITSNNDSSDSEDSETSLIQRLLDEIQLLKSKIQHLENNQTPSVRQAVFNDSDGSAIYFADWVSDYLEGKGHVSHKISAKKSIPTNALHEPDSYKNVNNSLALGRTGQVTLGFSESVSDKLIVFEATKESETRERAKIEVSADGKNWIRLNQTYHNGSDSYVNEYSYDLSEIGCITHVKITDITRGSVGDGFDVDALGATRTCTGTT